MKALNPMEQRRLTAYQAQIGAMSADDCLTLALESEQIAKDCGIADPAFPYLTEQSRVMLDYAALLERAVPAVAA